MSDNYRVFLSSFFYILGVDVGVCSLGYVLGCLDFINIGPSILDGYIQHKSTYIVMATNIFIKTLTDHDVEIPD